MTSFKVYEQFKKKTIIYENPEHHNNWYSSPGNKATSKTLHRLHIAQYTKTFSELSIMAHLAQMKLPRIQRHIWLWFQFSIFIPVYFHKAVIIASRIQTRQAVFFSRILQNRPKIGTASHSYFPLSWIYHSTSKDSDTLHYEATNTQNTPGNRIWDASQTLFQSTCNPQSKCLFR